MKTFGFALSVSAAASLVVGCGGSQPLISAPGVTAQTSAIASAPSAARRLSASYQQLYRFHPAYAGTKPKEGLLDVNGTLYGTTYAGGSSARGTVYRISLSGAHKVLYRFRGGSDGSNPRSVFIDVKGTLYGTTEFGGGGTGCYANGLGCGTVYSVSTSGTEKVLYAFKGGSDGAFPFAGLADVKGTLYGTTWKGGGRCSSGAGCGTVFSVTKSGKESVLHSFGSSSSDGVWPFAGLVAVNGTLYGTTNLGGSPYGAGGTVFSITTAGTEKVLHNFGGSSDGEGPTASLIDVNGTLYGTTSEGGYYKDCKIFSMGYVGCGTVFSVTTSGDESVLYRFDGSDGESPDGGLIDVSGTLYGTTGGGGTSGVGTVFRLGTSGTEQVLHSFAARGDGANPSGSLIDVNGTLYGTTNGGGTRQHGTVFALTP